MAYKICPRCFKANPYDELCKTPECQELMKSPTYQRDVLEGHLHIAKSLLADGDTSSNWVEIIRNLEVQLMQYDAHLSAAAFKQ